MNVGAAVAAADAGERGDGVPVAVTVTENTQKERQKIHLNSCLK